MKYTLRETAARRVRLAGSPQFRLPSFPGEPLVPRIFTATYFDTAGYHLARIGVILRRMTERKRGYWQLILPRTKSRLELEIPTRATISPAQFQDLLFGLLRRQPLMPIVKLRTRRSGMRIQTIDGPLADVVVDRISILNGQPGKGRFTDIEIELREGKEKDLVAIEEALRRAGATDGDLRPKMIKALDLPLGLPVPSLLSSAPPVEHLKNMLQEQVNNILIHDTGTRFGKDPEELHQMRVSTRRFRAFLRAARAFLDPEWQEQLHSELTWLGGSLGSVRDYDVLLSSLNAEAGSLPSSERKVFERILGTLETQRAKARAELQDALRSDRYLDLLSSLESAAHTPLAVDLPELSLIDLAGKEYKKLLKATKHHHDWDTDEALHRIRIRIKRLRHATELASITMGKSARRLIRQTKRVQDILGGNQDALVMEQNLRELLHTTRGVKSAFVMGQIVERLHKRRAHAKTVFPQALAKLKKRGREAFGRQLFKQPRKP